MATSEIERLLTSWAIAWSSKDSSNDPERVLALFVDDCLFEDVTFGMVARGKRRTSQVMKKPPRLLDLEALIAARSTGLEPVTSGVTGRRSNQLN